MPYFAFPGMNKCWPVTPEVRTHNLSGTGLQLYKLSKSYRIKYKFRAYAMHVIFKGKDRSCVFSLTNVSQKTHQERLCVCPKV